MNCINFFLVTVNHPEEVVIGGIAFSHAKFIGVSIDNKDLITTDPRFEDSVIVWEELFRSSIAGGKYLIFTSANGIADDDGWNYVKVEHGDDEISWLIVRDYEFIKYRFIKSEYLIGIELMKQTLKISDPRLSLIPTHIIFPE